MPSLTPGSEFAGHRIEEAIARGGMGVVYRAVHLALEIPVALKVISPESAEDRVFRERFRREARLAAQIEDPHVIPVRDAGEEEGLLYISMRLVDGPTLRQIVSASGALEPALAVEMVRQIAAGLDAAHETGLVHRDVKPANVLVEGYPDRPHAFLTDFGITRRQAADDDLTRTGRFVGSVDYIAPEQAQGRSVDARTDVYALGCLLHFVLAGSPPFRREDPAATVYAHLHDPPPALAEGAPGAPPRLEAVVERAMAKDPDERFPSAGALGEAARRALAASVPTAAGATEPAGAVAAAGAPTETAGAPTEAAAGGPGDAVGGEAGGEAGPPGGRGPRRRFGLGAALGLAAALLLAGVVFALARDGGSDLDPATEFVQTANAACTGIEQRVQDAYAAAGGQVLEGAVAQEVLEERTRIVREGVAELRTVQPPAGEGDRWRRYVEARARFADRLDELRAARAAGSPPAAREATARLDEVLAEKVRLGKGLGLDACADQLPPDQSREAAEVATQWLRATDPARLCESRITPAYFGSAYGGDRGRCEAELAGAAVSSATLVPGEDNPSGVEDVHATVELEGDGGVHVVYLDDVDGEWRVDGVRTRGP